MTATTEAKSPSKGKPKQSGKAATLRSTQQAKTDTASQWKSWRWWITPPKLTLPWQRSTAKPRGVARWVLRHVFAGVATYFLVLAMTVVVVPNLAAFLHQESGAADGALTGAGTVAMWIMPLLFVVLVLAGITLFIVRAMWKWAGKPAPEQTTDK